MSVKDRNDSIEKMRIRAQVCMEFAEDDGVADRLIIKFINAMNLDNRVVQILEDKHQNSGGLKRACYMAVKW